jgi:hypothetical protein
MKKIILFAFAFAFSCSAAMAQFSAGAELALPMGTPFSDFNGLGFGAFAKYQKELADKLNWTVSGGFQSFSGKSIRTIVGIDPQTFQPIFGDVNGPSLTLIPVLGGVQYFFSELNNGFYGSADVGLVFASGGGASQSKFAIVPGLGYRTGKLDFNVRYSLVETLNSVGLRVGYVFGE